MHVNRLCAQLIARMSWFSTISSHASTFRRSHATLDCRIDGQTLLSRALSFLNDCALGVPVRSPRFLSRAAELCTSSLRSWTCGTQMSSRAMELIWDVGQSVSIQHCLALVGAGVTIAPPFIPLPPLGVKSLIDSLLSFSLPSFTFPFAPSLSADFDLLVITVILSLVRTDRITPTFFGRVMSIIFSEGRDVLLPVWSALET